jgi:hypothetical protein
MVQINQLSTVATLTDGDQIPIFAPNQGDTRKASLSTLRAWFSETFASPEYDTLITAPTSSGFNLQIPAQTKNLWAILNPTGVFAAGTITLPPVASCFDGQQIIVTTTDEIAALTVAGNGASLSGAPSVLAAGAFFALRFNKLQSRWYCVSSSSQSIFTLLRLENLQFLGVMLIIDENGSVLISGPPAPIAAAVNNVQIVNSAAGDPVVIAAVGDDADIDIDLVPKGTGFASVGGDQIVTVTAAQTVTDKTFVDCSFTGPEVLAADVRCDRLETFPTTVAALGPATTAGVRRFVINANATTFASIVAGGGSNKVPVYSDGTDWRIG